MPFFSGRTTCLQSLNKIIFQVVWYKNNMRFDLRRGYRLENDTKNHFSLIISNVGEEDFANYTCDASNSLGRNRAMIQLRGIPSPPEILSQVSNSWKRVRKYFFNKGWIHQKEHLQTSLVNQELSTNPWVQDSVEAGRGNFIKFSNYQIIRSMNFIFINRLIISEIWEWNISSKLDQSCYIRT